MISKVGVLVVLCIGMGVAGPLKAADPFASAEIVITQDVVVEGIEPLGANLTTVTGGTNFATNQFIAGSGFEPSITRYLVRVDDFGDNWFAFDSDGGGVHMWDQNATGFGNGAQLWFFRIVDEQGEPLAYAEGMQDETGAHHVLELGQAQVPMPSAEFPEGGWVAEGSDGSINRVYMDTDAMDLAFGDYVFIEVKKTKLLASEIHPRLLQWFEDDVNVMRKPEAWTADLVTHPQPVPPEMAEPGETCLRVTATDGNPDWIGQYLFHAFDDEEGQWYSQLEPGISYRAEIWMRQEGLVGGFVRFISSGDYASINQSTPWTVTGQWQHFTYDFTGPAFPFADPWHQPLGLELQGPGTLWLDRFHVFRVENNQGGEPFAPHQLGFDELMAAFPENGRKPAIRFYPTVYHGHSDLDHMLGDDPNGYLDFIYNVGAPRAAMSIPQCLTWAFGTGDSPENRCIPYLTLSEEYLPPEWMGVVEYLGVPYDPTHDTPATKPWAYKRYVQRGHGEPWTDAFREIILEMGNETWHNGAGGHGWHGFGRPGWVFDGGTEYGLFFRHIFQDYVAAMPHWSAYQLQEKIHFCLNADYNGSLSGYGEAAAQSAGPVASYVGHANYVGPTWETGDIPFDAFDDHGMQETLVGFHTGMKDLIDEAAASRDLLLASGLADYQILAYEGGPSGYYLPGTGDPEQVEISEQFGKSLGMAVSALDCWLYSSLKGFSHQSFLGYSSGSYWTSHTMPRAGGFRRHAGWLALMMRNRHAPGDRMLNTQWVSVPTYERSGEDVPLISAYALQGLATTSVFVLSRKLDGEHDGVNFGDGTTPVTLHLPFDVVTGVDLYKLTAPDGSPADPRVNNRDAENVVITHQVLDPQQFTNPFVIQASSGGVQGGMPPGAVYLYVFSQQNCLLDGFNGWPAITVADMVTCVNNLSD